MKPPQWNEPGAPWWYRLIRRPLFSTTDPARAERGRFVWSAFVHGPDGPYTLSLLGIVNGLLAHSSWEVAAYSGPIFRIRLERPPLRHPMLQSEFLER